MTSATHPSQTHARRPIVGARRLQPDWSIYVGGALIAASSTSATLQATFGDSSFLTVNFLAGCATLVLAAGALLDIVQTGRLGFPKALSYPLLMLTAWILVELTRGWFAGNDRAAIVFDTLPYLLFFSVLHLATSPQTDRAFRRVMLATMVWGSLIALVSLPTLNYLSREDALESDAYKAQWALVYWPLFLWSSRTQRNGTVTVTVGSVAFGLTLLIQVLAQKRAPTVRVLVLVLLAWLLAAGIRRLEARSARLLGVVLVLVALTAVVLDATVFRRASDGLADRFTEASVQETLLTENARVAEAEWIIQDFNALEIGVGRGMGGAVIPREEVAWKEDNTVLAPHIGMALHLLKGGVVLIALFLLLYGSALWHARTRLGPLTGPAAAIILVTGLFQWQETLWGIPAAAQVVLLAYAIGIVSSRGRPTARISLEKE